MFVLYYLMLINLFIVALEARTNEQSDMSVQRLKKSSNYQRTFGVHVRILLMYGTFPLVIFVFCTNIIIFVVYDS
jgi:hypothetical protein